MIQINLLLISCVFLLSMLSANARAGVGTSGGGHVVVCDGHSLDKVVGYVTVLDLYEARHVLNLTLRAHQDSLEKELELLAKQLHVVLGNALSLPQPPTGDSLLEWWESRVQYIPRMQGHTADLGAVPQLPKACTVRQIAIFDDSNGVIHVNNDLWQSLDAFNKAALIAHELIYHERRLSDREASSQTSRFLVGRIFSTEAIADSNTMLSEYRANHPNGIKTPEEGP